MDAEFVKSTGCTLGFKITVCKHKQGFTGEKMKLMKTLRIVHVYENMIICQFHIFFIKIDGADIRLMIVDAV